MKDLGLPNPGKFPGPAEAYHIVRVLQEKGYQAVFAGGCVRDMLLGRMPHDWDIATSARPEEVEAYITRQGVKPVVKVERKPNGRLQYTPGMRVV